MADEDVFVTVIVDVTGVDAHVRLRRPALAHGAAGRERRLAKDAVPLVQPQEVGLTVVRHEQVYPAVPVEVRGDHPQRVADARAQATRCRDVDEGAVAAVAQETVGLGRIAQRAAVVGPSGFRYAGLMTFEPEAQKVADVQIQQTVSIDVDERCRDAPSRIVGPARCRDVCEAPPAIVVQQLVRAEPGHVEIDVTVGIEVARGHPLPVARRRQQTARRGDVGESQPTPAVR